MKRNKYLPRGVADKIAQKFGVSKQYVWAVKAGVRDNIEILEALIKAVEKYESKRITLKSKINGI